MNQPERDDKYRRQYAANLAMAGLAGQVGCLTLIIVILSIIAGLWLDKTFDTKPTFTILFVLGSAPLSIFLTFSLARRAVSNIKPLPPARQAQAQPEEDEAGEQ